MTQNTLVLLEVTGIQKYIFGSNQLAQNIGASELVLRATTERMVKIIRTMGLKTNIRGWDPVEGLQYTPGWDIRSGLDVEVVYGGGGNAMLLFAEDQTAGKFVRLLSRRVLEDAPGLKLVAIRDAFTWDGAPSLAEIHQQLRGKLAARKANRTPSTPLPGLGVTAACVYTDQPAVGFDQDIAIVGKDAVGKARHTQAQPRLISAEVAAKLRMEAVGKSRLKAALEDFMPPEFDFVYNFDEFGTPGESSYLAVVHADANQMSKRFDALASGHASPDKNGEYVLELRKLSQAIQERARTALQNTVVQLLHSRDIENGKFGGKIAPLERNGDLLLPFRPIVFGGDDTTFVCDGRLGIALAVNYLQEWTAGPLAGEPTQARAGVAVVNSHYPFARAYQLADELIASAKEAIPQLAAKTEPDITTLDWYFSTTGINYSLAELRDREYEARTGNSILMRPIRITSGGTTWRTWDVFQSLMNAFQTEKGEWVGRRNKIIALRDALRGGPSAVRAFRMNYRIDKLPEISDQLDMQTSGWQGEDCGYFDAIEAIDFFVPLDGNSEEGEAK